MKSDEGDTDTSDLLYGVVDWEPRSYYDVFCERLYRVLVTNVKIILVAVLVVALLTNLSLALMGLVLNPIVGVFALVSVFPAVMIAFYVWDSDPTSKRPAFLLILTFSLGTVATSVAYILNTAARPHFVAAPVLGTVLFFFLFVGPVEETLKLAAVYVYPMDTGYFSTALDGAVLGAFAGLGFATAENALYIATEGLLGGGGIGTLIGRAGVAPAHVLWSAIAGYYLGLAYTNREYAGALVLKGLLTVAVLHGAYNSFVTYAPLAVGAEPERLAVQTANFVFLAVFYGGVGYILYSLIERYRRAEREIGVRR